MSTLEPGMWIRLHSPVKPDAPLAVWRELADIEPQPHNWRVGLLFTDGYSVLWHRDNLDMFETATTDPRV